MYIGRDMTELTIILRNEWKEEEILITYYENSYLLSSYMNFVDNDPLNSALICTDAFYNTMTLQFSNIINVK
jgi:hypothetical protein